MLSLVHPHSKHPCICTNTTSYDQDTKKACLTSDLPQPLLFLIDKVLDEDGRRKDPTQDQEKRQKLCHGLCKPNNKQTQMSSRHLCYENMHWHRQKMYGWWIWTVNLQYLPEQQLSLNFNFFHHSTSLKSAQRFDALFSQTFLTLVYFFFLQKISPFLTVHTAHCL